MFYAIEGIDGAGCGVVRKELEKLLTKEKIKFASLKYPVPSIPFGRDIYDFLAEKITLPSEVQFLAFAGQMIYEKERIRQLRKKVLIIDRYLPCTLVFQGAKGFPLKKGLEFAKLFQIEKPNKIFYLKIPWQVGFVRKNAEKRQSDVHEKDKLLYQKTVKLYNQFAQKKVMGPWIVIDATQTPQQEAQEILTIILKDLEKQR